MAEETKDDAKEEGRKGLSPLIKKLLIMAVVLVIPACLGLVAFTFVISPMIEGPEEPIADLGERIPPEAVAVDFIDLQAALQAVNSTDGQSLLIYSVSLICDSLETSELILARKSWFDAMIDKQHRGRTKADIEDGLIVENINVQIRIEANKLLKRLNPEGSNMILEAMHSKLTPIEM